MSGVYVTMVLLLCASGVGLAVGVGRDRGRVARLGLVGTALAWCIHASVLRHHYSAVHRPALGPGSGGVPAGLWDHPLPSLGFLLLTAGLVLALLRPTARPLLALIVPVVITCDLGAVFSADRRTLAGLLPEQIGTAWFPVHALASFFGLIGFAVAAAAATFYLVQDWRLRRRLAPGPRLPSLEVLDRIVRTAAASGLAAFTLGMASGAFWAASTPQLGLDIRPKILATAVVWLAWSLLWPLRALLGWGGRRSSQVALVGFALLLGSVVLVSHR